MAVFRVEKSKDYTVMSNYHLRDNSLSLKAKGLLSQMLSLPDNWDYTLAGLAQINRESKDAIRAAVNELEQVGYIERRQTTDDNGKFSTNEYIIRECPAPSSPLLDFPTTGNPSTEKPSSENPTQLNIDIQNTDISKKKNKKEKSGKKKVASSETDFDPLALFAKWIMEVFNEKENRKAMRELYKAVVRFCENRVALKKPMKSKGAVTALCNKLMKLSGGDLGQMIELLDNATVNGWQSVFPLKGGPPNSPPPVSGRDKEWL